MSNTDQPPGDFARTGLPYADRIRAVSIDEPIRWLAAGWRDFRAAALASLSLGLIVVLAGFALTFVLAGAGYFYLTAPLIIGFMLVGPALTVGYYAISRDIEAGRPPSLTGALAAWRGSPAGLLCLCLCLGLGLCLGSGLGLGLGLALVAFLVLWMRFSALIFAIFFPYSMMDLQELVNATLFTTEGISFLVVGTLVGGMMATIAFAAGAFSLPMLLDRRVGMLEALFTGAGLLLGYVGLAVTLPLLGHASWHAYRATIRMP